MGLTFWYEERGIQQGNRKVNKILSKSDESSFWYTASQVALVVKNLLAKVGDARGVCSIPGSGRSPEESTATHSSIPAWRVPQTEEPGGLQSIRSYRVGHD